MKKSFQVVARIIARRMAFSVLLLAVGLASSCATVRSWRGGASDKGAAVQAEESMDSNPSASELEASLLRLVQRRAAEVEADSSNNQGRVIRKRPYYFKEYSSYQSEARASDVVLTETESRTAPYIADVKLEKIRHATRLHRSREEARLDNDFLRDTGVETLSYEFRNGHWTRVGSFFLAEKTEEQVNGEWVTVQRMLQRTVAAEEPEKGWFARSWSRVTGRN
ncbi:MAG: hypothetical protein L3K26_04445 [Candidatus Hydrogenedentes bacterium]|nr:hypothetical protein [Candidatus Hydrogenedentota bacterium]